MTRGIFSPLTNVYNQTLTDVRFLSRFVRVHLRSLKDGEPHPDAAEPVLKFYWDGTGGSLEIFEHRLGMMLIPEPEQATAKDTKFLVWDWMEGTLIAASPFYSFFHIQKGFGTESDVQNRSLI